MADKFSRFPLVGSIISAIIASICCIGPVILAILGLGGAGLFSKFGSFRPYLIGVTAILLGLAFYLTYRKREVLCEDGTCKIKGASRWNKIALWVATGLIAFLIAFPYLNLSNQNSANNQTGGEIVELTLFVEGMTCSGCEFNVENAVGKLDGIIKVKANYQKADVYVKFEKDKVTVDKIVEAINKSVYRATKQ